VIACALDRYDRAWKSRSGAGLAAAGAHRRRGVRTEPVRREQMMTAWLEITARALADRKGVISIEYAMIAAGATTIIVACYNTYFDRVSSLIANISVS
jgi:Flp pilus assembly pilin Flp